MTYIKKVTVIASLSVSLLISCNPVSEDIAVKSFNMWNSLHPAKPFMSDFYHGAGYRFPSNACDEPQCHGSLLTGGNSGAPSCYTCHTDQWTVFSTTHTLNVSNHYHHIGVDTGYDTGSSTAWFTQCKSCHGAGLDGTGGTAVYSCRVCHTGFTGPIPPPGHRLNRSGAWHHYSAGDSPSSACAGAACHGTGGYAGANGPKCGNCHGGSAYHTVKPYQSTYFHGSSYRFPAGACDSALCHGSSLGGGNTGAPSCYSCHTDQWTVFSTTHTVNLSNRYHHTGVNTDYKNSSSNSTWFAGCKTCHGTNLDGSGGTAVYSCKTCHSGFSGSVPPPGHNTSKEGNWHHYNSSHGFDQAATYCAGAACHGAGGTAGGTAATTVTGISGHGQACASSGCHD